MITLCSTLAAAASGIDVILCVAMVLFSCEMGYILPTVSGGAAYLYSQDKWVTLGTMSLPGMGFLLIETVMLCTIGVFWAGVVFP